MSGYVVRLALCLALVSVTVTGYKVAVDPPSIDQLPVSTSQRIRVGLTDCGDSDDTSGNFSLHQTVVVGLDNSILFPSRIYDVPCCSNQTANSSGSLTGAECGKNVTIEGNAMGVVWLIFKDLTVTGNRTADFNYSVGIIRPPADVKDSVFLYGLIVSSVINTIMFGAGLDLEKVKKYLKRPLSPAIGAGCQFIFMPLVAFVITIILNEHPSLELGLFAAGACPGGGASNAWAYMLGGDVDLSITMTFISTFAALAFVPLWMYTLGSYVVQGMPLTLPFTDMLATLAYFVVPTALGLLCNRFLPKVARILVKTQRVFLPCFVIFIIVMSIWANIYAFTLLFVNYQLLFAGMALTYCGSLLGFVTALLFKQKLSLAITIGLETGIQNSSIATILLRTSLQQPWADISSIMPIVLPLTIPWLLWPLVMIRLVYLKCCKKPEKEEEEEDEDDADVSQSETDVKVSDINFAPDTSGSSHPVCLTGYGNTAATTEL